MEGKRKKCCDKRLAVIAEAGKKINESQIIIYLTNASISTEVF